MQQVIDEVAEGGVQYLVCANSPTATLEEIKSTIEVLNKTGRLQKKQASSLHIITTIWSFTRLMVKCLMTCY
ncbi:hypothetical protein ACFJIV_09280 [Mucilaginibacter sp. UC70_90]